MASRCAVVDQSGAVANVIMADPETDTIPGFSLVSVPDESEAGMSWVWNGSTFEMGEELAAEKAAEDAAYQASIEQEAQSAE
jgi:hypothetical protein